MPINPVTNAALGLSWAPGIYGTDSNAQSGPGRALLLRMNEQAYLVRGQNIAAGALSSQVQLERAPRANPYPWGAAVQIAFSGSPGTFEIDLMGSETDESSGSYLQLASLQLTAVNASNFGRIDMPPTVWPKYVALLFKTFPNGATITTTAVITR